MKKIILLSATFALRNLPVHAWKRDLSSLLLGRNCLSQAHHLKVLTYFFRFHLTFLSFQFGCESFIGNCGLESEITISNSIHLDFCSQLHQHKKGNTFPNYKIPNQILGFFPCQSICISDKWPIKHTPFKSQAHTFLTCCLCCIHIHLYGWISLTPDITHTQASSILPSYHKALDPWSGITRENYHSGAWKGFSHLPVLHDDLHSGRLRPETPMDQPCNITLTAVSVCCVPRQWLVHDRQTDFNQLWYTFLSFLSL